MRYVTLILSLAISSYALAQDLDRSVAGKLTSYKKPQVLVLTVDQQKVAAMNAVVLNLDVDPNEIICRKESVGRPASSRLKVQRCRTRADIRQQAERQLARFGRDAENYKRRTSVRRSPTQLRDRRNENRARRGLGN